MNTKDVKKFLAELQQHLNKATDSIAFFQDIFKAKKTLSNKIRIQEIPQRSPK